MPGKRAATTTAETKDGPGSAARKTSSAGSGRHAASPQSAEQVAATLKEPANQVSAKAPTYWRVGSAIRFVIVAVIAGVAWYFTSRIEEWPWWGYLPSALVLVPMLIDLLFMPSIRYRVHRWEVTPTAVFTRSGWLSREQRIAPLSRVQTVDSHQGMLMRLWKLSSITVTTASAAGPVTITCLDADVAQRVVAELTAITGASEGDAT